VKWWRGGGGEQLNVPAFCHFPNGQSSLLLSSYERVGTERSAGLFSLLFGRKTLFPGDSVLRNRGIEVL